MKSKYIFVSGGVMSAVGKGVAAASISLLLKQHGFSVCPIKCENNLNVDFGTINPKEHGDPFLCSDGSEADVDLGNYERFLDQEVGSLNYMTMGQLYSTVIQNERNLYYKGEDVEPIPHIVNEIISRIKIASVKTKADFIIIELGGTVGEYENNNGLYYEASRILSATEQVAHIHVTYVPVPPHINEPKTKPAQFGLKALMSMGINPNFIIIRSEKPVNNHLKEKFGMKFFVDPKDVFSCENLSNIYQVPNHLYNQDLDKRILKFFNVKSKKKEIDLSFWKNYSKALNINYKNKVTIAIVGKYFLQENPNFVDSYYALVEALEHARIFNKMDLNLKLINSITSKSTSQLQNTQGIIIPIGHGKDGVSGKISAIKFARENKIPFLGLGLGMQLACVEFAQNVLKLQNANSEEVSDTVKDKVITSIPYNKTYHTMKGSSNYFRLGSFQSSLKSPSLILKIYKNHTSTKIESPYTIEERYKNHYEFNSTYLKDFEKKGMVFSGRSSNYNFIESIELSQKEHPFFLGVLYHPEYKSSPQNPHPIFIEFLSKTKAILQDNQSRFII